MPNAKGLGKRGRGEPFPVGIISRRGAEGAEEFSVRVVGGVGGI